jgi:hypothetical protein
MILPAASPCNKSSLQIRFLAFPSKPSWYPCHHFATPAPQEGISRSEVATTYFFQLVNEQPRRKQRGIKPESDAIIKPALFLR